MGAVRKRLTYANVIATLALFLALSGGVVWASEKIGAKKLKANSVTAGKIKRNAVSAAKIRSNAVTTAKIKSGAVTFAKLATGANVIARASSIPIPVSATNPATVFFVGTTTFTPTSAAADFLSVEAKADDLGRVGTEPCEVRIVPFVNGSQWDIAEGALTVSAFAPTPERPTGLIPVTGGTAPIGLASPGVTQTVSAKVFGDPDCTPVSTVSVAIAVTQAK